MAIALRSSNYVAVASGASPLVLTKPTGLAVGDLLVVIVGGANDYYVSSIPTGWTKPHDTYSSEGNQCHMAVIYKVADSSDVSASNFSFSISTGQAFTGYIMAFSGVNTSDPWGASAITVNNSDTTTPSFTGITPDGTDTMLILAVNHTENKRTVGSYSIATSNPTWTELYDYSGNMSGTGRAFAMSVAYALRSASTATGSAGVTYDVGIENRQVGVLISLNPKVSTNYPLSVLVGSFTLTGKAMLQKIGRKITTSVSSFILTGKDIITKLGKGLSATVSNFVLSGYDIIVNKDISILTSTGSFILTGINTILRYGRTILLDTSSFVLSGKDILTHYGYALISSTGSFIIITKNAILNIGRRIYTQTSSFILSGIDIIITKTLNIITSVGEFTLTGINVMLNIGKTMSTQVSSFVLTGIDSLFHIGYMASINTVSFILTGISARFSIIWKTITKNLVSFTNSSKNSSSWINQDKSNII